MHTVPTSAPPEQGRCISCRRKTATRPPRASRTGARPPASAYGPMPGRTCEICGGTYDATWRGQRTCSRGCGWELRQQEGKVAEARTVANGWAKAWAVHPGECRLCGQLFVARARNRRSYCYDHTAEDIKRDQWRRDNARVSELLHQQPGFKRTCLHCGAEFTTRHTLKIYCTQRCSKRARKRDRQRARRAGVAYSYVSRAKVCARDRWMCGLCGCKVDRMLAYPDDMCASLDHIVPMSRGGPHEYDNVQLAHLRCNINKGADVDLDVDAMMIA